MAEAEEMSTKVLALFAVGAGRVVRWSRPAGPDDGEFRVLATTSTTTSQGFIRRLEPAHVFRRPPGRKSGVRFLTHFDLSATWDEPPRMSTGSASPVSQVPDGPNHPLSP